MSGSKQVKREFGFLWRIIAVFFFFIGLNSAIKAFVDERFALKISFSSMALILILASVIYLIKLKPVLNQFIVFVLCLGVSVSSTVFYIYDLPYKNHIGAISIPLFLVFCGMWIYSKYAVDEV